MCRQGFGAEMNIHSTIVEDGKLISSKRIQTTILDIDNKIFRNNTTRGGSE